MRGEQEKEGERRCGISHKKIKIKYTVMLLSRTEYK